MDISIIYNSKDKVSELIILLEFLNTACENFLGKNWLQLTEIWYSHSYRRRTWKADSLW